MGAAEKTLGWSQHRASAESVCAPSWVLIFSTFVACDFLWATGIDVLYLLRL
jgi:hypothetical protein